MISLLTSVCALATCFMVPELPWADSALRPAIEKSLKILQRGMAGHVEHRTCFACHNQALPILAMAEASRQGFEILEKLLREQTDHVTEFVTNNRNNYLSGKGTGGQVDTAGWLLQFYAATKQYPAHKETQALVTYFKKRDASSERWKASSNRPPSEASSFTANYLAVVGVKMFAGPNLKDFTPRFASVLTWARKTPAQDTEDQVFRLLLLHALDAEKTEIKRCAQTLARQQRRSGGWGQKSTMAPDVYATATTLYALLEVGVLTPRSQETKRAIHFLLQAQHPDGSWFVKSRSRPFQKYYESGYPHGNDQFISITAGSWATRVLVKVLPKK